MRYLCAHIACTSLGCVHTHQVSHSAAAPGTLPASPTAPTLPPQELYGGRLSAHASVAGHTMAGLAGGGPGAAEVPVLLLVDSAGCDMEEQAAEDGDSKVKIAGVLECGVCFVVCEV